MSTVVGVSTGAGIPAVEGVPSAVDINDVPFFSAAVHQGLLLMFQLCDPAAVVCVPAESRWLLYLCRLSHCLILVVLLLLKSMVCGGSCARNSTSQ
jgi:hypothetical protein